MQEREAVLLFTGRIGLAGAPRLPHYAERVRVDQFAEGSAYDFLRRPARQLEGTAADEREDAACVDRSDDVGRVLGQEAVTGLRLAQIELQTVAFGLVAQGSLEA